MTVFVSSSYLNPRSIASKGLSSRRRWKAERLSPRSLLQTSALNIAILGSFSLPGATL
jgi:hypothetical protein